MTLAVPHQSPATLSSLRGAGPIALFVDFDGTLVEIATTPDGIVVASDLAAGLERLAASLEGRLALVSGRSLEDIARHLGDGLQVAKAGSHGADRRHSDGSVLGQLPQPLSAETVAALEEFADKNGLRYETKTHGGALHYRENPAAGDVAHGFAQQIARDHGLAIKTGKCVVELVRPGADKGSAVRAFMEQSSFNGALPIFLGDDVTDEDGFAACEELGGFGILVGEPRESRARFILASVSETHQWLGL